MTISQYFPIYDQLDKADRGSRTAPFPRWSKGLGLHRNYSHGEDLPFPYLWREKEQIQTGTGREFVQKSP